MKIDASTEQYILYKINKNCKFNDKYMHIVANQWSDDENSQLYEVHLGEK